MIVLDGMPGTGKSTLLGAAISAGVVFPETQPPPNADECGALAWLLAEDRARTRAAAALPRVASDRCHLGVLAYRYARAAAGYCSWAEFHHARQLVGALRLDQHHADDLVLILHLDPAVSLQRRAAARNGSCWFDRGFLHHYARFWNELDRWITPGPAWRHLDAAQPETAQQIAAVLAPANAPDLLPGQLACGSPLRCGQPRSPVTRTSTGAVVQLWSGALHHHTPGGPVRCLRTAADLDTLDHTHTETEGAWQ